MNIQVVLIFLSILLLALARNGLFLRRGENDEVMHVEDGKMIYSVNRHQ